MTKKSWTLAEMQQLYAQYKNPIIATLIEIRLRELEMLRAPMSGAGPVPPRFEDEDPQTAGALQRLSHWKDRTILLGAIKEDGTMRWCRPNFKLPGRNDLCGCGSGLKFKKCCEAVTL